MPNQPDIKTNTFTQMDENDWLKYLTIDNIGAVNTSSLVGGSIDI
jgi:hypothetical protein